jgi:four helix bundle protein
MALEFYREVVKIKCPYHLKDQLQRAALSVELNLSEGTSKISRKEKVKFYNISFCSLREVQAVLDILNNRDLASKADHLAALIFKLCASLH